MSDTRKMFDLGSLLNSSEGILSTAACAALASATTTSDYRVACAACIGLAVLGATYTIMRAITKARIAEIEE